MRKFVTTVAMSLSAFVLVVAPASAAPTHPFKHAHKHLSCLKLLTWQEYRRGCPLVPLGAPPPPMPGKGHR